MKQLIFLIACLFCMLSCNEHTAGSIDETEILLAKEKRTPVQSKKYRSKDAFDVSITSDKKETRTLLEAVQNHSPKYEITNTVSFGCLTLWDVDLSYTPEFEIKK